MAHPIDNGSVVRSLSADQENHSRTGRPFQPKLTNIAEQPNENGGPRPSATGGRRQNESMSEGDNLPEGRNKKKRRRRANRKRRWKPYAELSWEEKKKLDEKESLRASRIRAEMFAKGQPVAPYNTTQFLMDDHDLKEPDLKVGDGTPKKVAGRTTDTSEEDDEDGYGVSSDDLDDEEFLQRDFSETYERYHTESLEDMTKQELIKEYLELERCLTMKEEENRKLSLNEEQRQRAIADQRRIQELETEIEQLKEENLRLIKERTSPTKDPANADESELRTVL